MSAASALPKVAGSTLQQWLGSRRANAALLERDDRFFEPMIRLQQPIMVVQIKVQALRSDIRGRKADVLLLENHNANPHGEACSIIGGMDDAGVPAPCL